MSQMATVAISLAAGFAAQTVASWLQPTKVIDNGGLSDLSIPKSNYGVVMPQAWGTVAMSGNLIWATHKEEQIKKKKRGKGGGGVVEKERSYYGNCAWLFAYTPRTPALYFKRVWMNGKIVYSTVGDAETIDNGNNFASQYLRFYLGSNLQTPDPLLESLTPSSTYDYGLPHDPNEREAALISLGLDPNTIHTPAYRYRTYLVAERIPLNDFGNNLPTVKAEIVFTEPAYLANIISDICEQIGLTSEQIEVGNLSGISVTGFYLDNVTKASEALQLLQQCYFFDIIQSQGKLIFLPQSALRPVINLDNTSLAARSSGQTRPDTYTEEPEYIEALPSEVDVNFIDPDLDYDENTAKARSQVSLSSEKKVYNLPIVLSADNAIALAEKMLHQHYLTNKTYTFTLPPAYSWLEVGDRILLNNQTVQITKLNLGANYLVSITAKLFDSGSISTINVTRSVETGGYNAPNSNNVITAPGDTTLLVLDIPLIVDRDDDYGVYVAGGGGSNWNGADIYVSIDGSTYELVSGLDTYSIYGTTNTSLNSSGVEVTINKGNLASATTADLDIGYNKALIGDEIVQFQTATLTDTNTYNLSDIRRGLRGTDWVDYHAVSERFVLLTGDNAYIERITNTAITPGQMLYFKAVSTGQSLDSVSPVTITYQGNDLKPYAPTNITATRDEVGNITVNWSRRDRKAGEATDLIKIPLSETREEYIVEVKQNANTIRTTNTYKNYYNYTQQEQITDFGGIQSSISLVIYQVSAAVGRGFGATVTVTPSFSAANPTINSFTPVQGIEGDTVTITGSGLAGITEVTINDVIQDNLAVASDTNASFVVTVGTVSGFITVSAPGGNETSNNVFIINTGTGGGGTAITTLLITDSIVDATVNTRYIISGTTRLNLPPGVDENIIQVADSNASFTTNPLNIVCDESNTFFGTSDNLITLDNDGTTLQLVFLSGSWYRYGGNGNVTPSFVLGEGAFPVNGLVNYWKLDEASGTRIDSVGSNNLVNGTSVPTTAGLIGNAVNFSSVSTGIYTQNNVPFPPNSSTDGSFSISLWCKSSIWGNYHALVYIRDINISGNSSYKAMIWVQTSGSNATAALRIYDANNVEYQTPNVFDGTAALIVNSWNHVVTTYNNTTKEAVVYINNVGKSRTFNIVSIRDTNTDTIGIGGSNFTFNNFNGQIDEVGIWDKALNAAEVNNLYNSGLGLTYSG